MSNLYVPKNQEPRTKSQEPRTKNQEPGTKISNNSGHFGANQDPEWDDEIIKNLFGQEGIFTAS